MANSIQPSQSAQNFLLERSFKAQFADASHFHRNWMGDIIVLVGTSTAGKSSLIQALRRIEPERIEDGGDLKTEVILFQYLKKQYPVEVAVMQKVMRPLDIPRAILAGERPWQMMPLTPEQAQAEEVIQGMGKVEDSLPLDELFQNTEPLMIDDAFERSRRGESVIFDVLKVATIANRVLMRKFDGPIRKVLVYCPFSLLSSRMTERNRAAAESGQLSNQRRGAFPFRQFADIYTRKQPEQSPLETITRAQAIKTFTENLDQEILVFREKGFPLPSEEQLQIDKSNMTQEFLKRLGFTDDVDEIEIAPRDPEAYDLIINSGQVTATEAAHILHT